MPTMQRLSIQDVDPDVYPAVLGLEKYVASGGLDARLLLLVRIRASQLNHCAWCLDMHLAEARKAGIGQRKLDVIAAWREAPALFEPAERAALAFTEQVTLISVEGVSDDVWDGVTGAFDNKQAVHLLMAIAAINVWNRMNVAVHTDLPAQPGAGS